MHILFLTNVLNRFNRGWIKVDLIGKDNAWLPYGTSFGKIQKNTLRVLDGHYRGYLLDTTENKELENCLGDEKLLTNEEVNIVYNPSLNKLSLQNKREFSLVKFDLDELKAGGYQIEVPRFPHVKLCKRIYLNENDGGSRFAETWFEVVPLHGPRLGVFIHYGEISSGCITVSMKENLPKSWDEIYFNLILHRISYKTVATLTVI